MPIEAEFGWDVVKGLLKAIVAHMAKQLPKRFVKAPPMNLRGGIFIDSLRNGHGATTVCAWSARARPGLGVSVPVTWDELVDFTSSAYWNVTSVTARFAIGNELWALYDASAVQIYEAHDVLGLRHPSPTRNLETSSLLR